MIFGTVKSWNDLKGIGYIIPEGGGYDIIFRAKGIPSGFREIKEGDRVSYEITPDSTGKPEATKIIFVE